jgi:hypothetical protein
VAHLSENIAAANVHHIPETMSALDVLADGPT